MSRKLLSALISIFAFIGFGGLSPSATAQPARSGPGPSTMDQVPKTTDAWPKTVTPANSPFSVPGPGNRTIPVSSGRVKIHCVPKHNPDGSTTMTYEFEVDPRTTFTAGPPGADWSDSHFTLGSRANGDISGSNISVTMAGYGGRIVTHGSGGGTITTGPDAHSNTGDIDGTHVNFDMAGGSGNSFNYDGGVVGN